MPNRSGGVLDVPSADNVIGIALVEKPSPDIKTTLTADPGTGTTIAIAAWPPLFPAAGNFKAKIEKETIKVTGGHGTTSITAVRGIDGSTAVAHASGIIVARVLAYQQVEPVVASKVISYLGRTNTFRITGRAGTAGQKLFAIHNSNTSQVLVDVTKIRVDTIMTAAKAIGVIPPVIRVYRFTALPMGGNAGTKVPVDTSLTSNSQVTLWQDAASDGGNSTTALAVTPTTGAIVDQEYAPRMITGAGYEMFDRTEFLEDESAFETLRPLEGLLVALDYNIAVTQNPATDFYLVSAKWEEYTPA